jgi:hypothetical protein
LVVGGQGNRSASTPVKTNKRSAGKSACCLARNVMLPFDASNRVWADPMDFVRGSDKW